MPAQVSHLHPAPARSPERERLAEAIERRAAAADHLARIKAATPPAWERLWADEPAVEAAEETIRQARLDEPRRLAALALGEELDDRPTVAQATAAAAAAREALDLNRKILHALEDRERSAAADLDAAVVKVRTAARAVVAAGLAGLAAEFVAARERIAIIENIATSLPPGCFPGDVSRFPAVDIGRDEARAWMAALETLEHDPDAALPSDPPEPPAAAA